MRLSEQCMSRLDYQSSIVFENSNYDSSLVEKSRWEYRRGCLVGGICNQSS